MAQKAAPARKGIRVSSSTILRLAQSGVQPTGTLVPADGERPAGLRLSGVGGLGIGLQDGDVLTEAGGLPARSRGDVVSVVLAARGRRAPEIGGVFWRNGERWLLSVEQPYVAPTPKE